MSIKRRTLSSCFFVFALSLPFTPAPLHADEAEEVATSIVKLVKQSKYEQALELVELHQLELEGLPIFDFASGLTAKSVGRLNDAVFALERVLQAEPMYAHARYLLATSYFELGNLIAAQREFAILQQQSISAELIPLVANYQAAIKQKMQNLSSYWANWIQIGGGTDSNVNNGVDAEFLLIPSLGQVTLFDENKQINSTFFDIAAQVTYIAPLDQKSGFYLTSSVQHASFEESLAWSRTFLNLGAGYHKTIKTFELETQFFYRPILLDSDSYLNYSGVSLQVSQAIGDTTNWGSELVLAKEAYDQQKALNRDQLIFNVWFQKQYLGGAHKLSIKVGQENAEKSENDFVGRNLLGVGYQWSQLISDNWMTRLSANYADFEYDKVNPLFEELRKDAFKRAELEAMYRYSPNWQWIAKISYIDNDSEIEIYQYKRTKLWVGTRYDF